MQNKDIHPEAAAYQTAGEFINMCSPIMAVSNEMAAGGMLIYPEHVSAYEKALQDLMPYGAIEQPGPRKTLLMGPKK